MKALVLSLTIALLGSFAHAATVECIASTGSGFRATLNPSPLREYHAPSATLSNLSVRVGAGEWKTLEQGEGFVVLGGDNGIEYASVSDNRLNVVLAFVNRYGHVTTYSDHQGSFSATCTVRD